MVMTRGVWSVLGRGQPGRERFRRLEHREVRWSGRWGKGERGGRLEKEARPEEWDFPGI